MSRTRLNPPIWRHDAYTLRQLATALRSMINRHISSSSGRIADLGAGEAPYRPLFEKNGWNYLSLDLEGNKSDLTIKPGLPLPLPNKSVELVVSFQVLEHVWDLEWYLGEAHRILMPHGKFIISTHGVWPYHPHPGDYRRWTKVGLVAELESRGFKVREIIGVVGPLAWTTQFRTIGLSLLLSRLPVLGPILNAFICGLRYLQMAIEDKLTPPLWKENNAAIYLVLAESLCEKNTPQQTLSEKPSHL